MQNAAGSRPLAMSNEPEQEQAALRASGVHQS